VLEELVETLDDVDDVVGSIEDVVDDVLASSTVTVTSSQSCAATRSTAQTPNVTVPATAGFPLKTPS
jgi:hypothetical protein